MKQSKLSDYSLFPLFFLAFLGTYNIIVGFIYLFVPNLYFILVDMDLPFYPLIWQFYSFIYICLGIGLTISAFNPSRFWPVLLLNALFKLFVSCLFIFNYLQGLVPNGFIYDALLNNFIWVIPLLFILNKIYNLHIVVDSYNYPSFEETIHLYTTNYKQTIAELSKDRHVLVVFLRHFGCVFCREILHTLNKNKDQIENQNLILVIVHMIDNDTARKQLSYYGLENVDCISDPERNLYRSFGLRRGRLYQIFGLRVWWKGFIKGILKGRGFGTEVGDVLQMSGMFLLRDLKVLKSFIPEYISELPELSTFIKNFDKEYEKV